MIPDPKIRPTPIFFILALSVSGLFAANEAAAYGIKDIVKKQFPKGNVWIGCAAHWSSLSTNRRLAEILDREFDYITPANDMKQSTVHPDPETWNWELTDLWIQRAVEKKQTLRVHGPMSAQCSRWAREDQRTAAELEKNLAEYMSAQAKRYEPHKSTIRWLDVVNETVHSDGQWKSAIPGVTAYENPWSGIGLDPGPEGFPLYIKKAFEIAGALATGIKLIINQDSMAPKSVEKLQALILWLRSHKLRVDGIGYQFHIASGWETKSDNLERLIKNVDWAQSQGLEFHLTEFQAYLHTEEERKNRTTFPPEEKSERLAQQAATFETLLKTLLERRNRGTIAVNFWHLFDLESYERDGNLFEADGKPRPAYHAVRKILENPPSAK